MKKVLIAVGGSGGHVLPAEALVEELKQKQPDIECLFVGSHLKTNPFFNKTLYKYEDIASASISFKNPLKCIRDLRILIRGILAGRKIVRNFKPDVVVGFGSYHSFSILAASSIENKPIVLHAADSVPGRTIRFLSLFSKVSTVYFNEAKKKLKGFTIQVRHPIKNSFYQKKSKEQAALYFNLDPKLFTLLVFGGSQGAHAINVLFKNSLFELKKTLPSFQVIHLTGDLKMAQEMEILYKQLNIKACVKNYENNLDTAWALADLAIVRSGAGTIAEHVESEVPCIFIPYPYAKDLHQDKNADFMVFNVGGALKISESKATVEVLTEKIRDLVTDDFKLLKEMKKALAVHKKNSTCECLSDIVISVGSKK